MLNKLYNLFKMAFVAAKWGFKSNPGVTIFFNKTVNSNELEFEVLRTSSVDLKLVIASVEEIARKLKESNNDKQV